MDGTKFGRGGLCGGGPLPTGLLRVGLLFRAGDCPGLMGAACVFRPAWIEYWGY